MYLRAHGTDIERKSITSNRLSSAIDSPSKSAVDAESFQTARTAFSSFVDLSIAKGISGEDSFAFVAAEMIFISRGVS